MSDLDMNQQVQTQPVATDSRTGVVHSRPRALCMLGLTNSVRGLQVASDQLEIDAPSDAMLNQIIGSGVIRPRENEQLAYWFARYLSVRQGLREVVNTKLSVSSQLLT